MADQGPLASLVEIPLNVPSGSPPLRILHLLTRFASGGSERRVGQFIDALDGEHFVAFGPESHAQGALQLVAEERIIELAALRRQPHPLRDARALAELVALMRRGRFDLIHTVQSKAGILGRTAARLSGRPPVIHALTMANFGPGFGLAGAAYRAAERRAAAWTDRYAVVGPELQDRYLSAGVGTRDQYRVIRSAIDVSRLSATSDAARRDARAWLRLAQNQLAICHVGALEPRKRVLRLPAVLKELHAVVPDAVLIVAGDGELREQLERDAAEAGVRENFRLLGHTARVAEVMAASDCLVLLSEAEGVPQVLVQAAASGTPFVSSPVDGAQEILDLGAAGRRLSRIGSAAEIAGALADGAALGRQRLDPARFDGWRREVVLDAYRDLVGEVLSERGGDPSVV